MVRRIVAILLAGAIASVARAETPAHPPAALTYYAGMPGRLTTDRDAEGGNPFASALVEVWADPALKLRDFGTRVAALTMR